MEYGNYNKVLGFVLGMPVLEEARTLEGANPLEKVLVIDDDVNVVNSISEMISMEYSGVEILTAGNGSAGLRKYKEEKPELVILDDMLPIKSGFLVLEGIRLGAHRDRALPYIIMIADNRGKRHKVYAESLGVNSHLYKPFEMNELRECVEKFVQDKGSYQW